MAKSSEEERQRYPNLSKLSVAILEHLVESTLGESAIEEVKKPYAEKQIADSLEHSLVKVEAEFIEQYKDQEARDALLQLSIHDFSSISKAIWAFYKNPNDKEFSKLLITKLKEIKSLRGDQVNSAVDFYLNLFRRELVNVDKELREKIQTLAILDMADGFKELVKRKTDVSAPISQPITNKTESPDQKISVQKGSLPTGSYLPFTRNALFTGRKDDFHKLVRSLLGENHSSPLISQTITGMGGIGKTQLAVEFAFRYGYNFKGVHWLDMHDLATIDSQIAQCGTQMLLQPWSDELPEQVILTLTTWKQDGPRLLILDNFEDSNAGSEILSRFQDPALRLLITSRRSDWPSALGLIPLPLKVFTEQESNEFLRKYTKDNFISEQLGILAERLGHLPLALELAGRYLEKHKRLIIEQYLTRLEKALDHESMRGYRKDLPNPTKHDLDLLSTFSLSWDQVKDETAQKLFMVAGYCASNAPIPPEIFERTLDLGETACDGALAVLSGLGLMKENATIHPLLADYARFLDRENSILSLLVDRLTDIANERNEEVDLTGNYMLYSPLLIHVRSVAEKAEAVRIQKGGDLWNGLGYHIHNLADYAGAKAAFERALKIDEAAFDHEHPNVARDINNLGKVLQDQGDLVGAKTAFERALKIDEAAFGSEHPNVARDVNNLGSVLRDQGDLWEAKAAFERSLKINEAALGPDHPNVATFVNNLGRVLQDLGDLEDAKAAYERALKIDEAAFGHDHPMVALDVNNLGGVLKDQNDLVGAKATFERALKIDEAAFGHDHPNVAADVNNMGMVLKDQGDLAGAKAAFERARKINETALGPNHPNVATDVHNLGLVLKAQGDLAGAKAAYERALNIDIAVFGLYHPKVATVVNNLGVVLKAQGDLAGAKAAFEHALRILQQFLPEGHPNIKIVEENLRRLGGSNS